MNCPHHCEIYKSFPRSYRDLPLRLAGLIYKLLNGASPDEALDFACALGAMVATHIGPTPTIETEEIERFRHPV